MPVIVPAILSIFGDQWVQLLQKEKDHKILPESFSYNRGNTVILVHQFDEI